MLAAPVRSSFDGCWPAGRIQRRLLLLPCALAQPWMWPDALAGNAPATCAARNVLTAGSHTTRAAMEAEAMPLITKLGLQKDEPAV